MILVSSRHISLVSVSVIAVPIPVDAEYKSPAKSTLPSIPVSIPHLLIHRSIFEGRNRTAFQIFRKGIFCFNTYHLIVCSASFNLTASSSTVNKVSITLCHHLVIAFSYTHCPIFIPICDLDLNLGIAFFHTFIVLPIILYSVLAARLVFFFLLYQFSKYDYQWQK